MLKAYMRIVSVMHEASACHLSNSLNILTYLTDISL